MQGEVEVSRREKPTVFGQIVMSIIVQKHRPMLAQKTRFLVEQGRVAHGHSPRAVVEHCGSHAGQTTFTKFRHQIGLFPAVRVAVGFFQSGGGLWGQIVLDFKRCVIRSDPAIVSFVLNAPTRVDIIAQSTQSGQASGHERVHGGWIITEFLQLFH